MDEIRHKFAVVLAADVVRFSGHMETDGEATVHALKSLRDAFQRCIDRHQGQEFGSVGDSFMAEFTSPIEAIRAAQEIHKALESDESGGNGQGLQVRIGLHAGDVLCDDDAVYGDVVNTAARLQQFTQPGGTALSALVYEQVKKEPGLHFRPLGRQVLKNIAEPVFVYEVESQHQVINWQRVRLAIRPYRSGIAAIAGMAIAAILIVMYLETSEPIVPGPVIDVPPANSIAVMPFTVTGADEELPVLKGMQCGVISRLDKLDALERVTSCRVARRQDPASPIRELGLNVSVSKLLFGEIRQRGNRVLVEVELIEASNGARHWGESYDRNLNVENLFEIESEIARAAVAALGLDLSEEDNLRLGGMPTFSLDALREFQRGQFEMERREFTALERAEQHFLEAIEIDPMFADAYVGLANAFALRVYFRTRYYAGNGSPTQREYLLHRALELDPDNSLAIAGLGLLHFQQREVEEAEEYFRRAIDLIPNAYEPYYWYSVMLGRLQRAEEAMEMAERAHDVAPNEPVVISHLASVRDWQGRHDEALELIEDGLRTNPDFADFYVYIYKEHWNEGRVGEALRWAENALAVAPFDGRVNLHICQLYFRMQEYDQTEICLDGLKAHGKFFAEHYIALFQRRRELDEIAGVLDWVARRPLGPQGRFKIFASDRDRIREAYQRLQIGDFDRAFEIMRVYGPYLFDDDGNFTGEVDVTRPMENGKDAYMTLYAAIALHKQGFTEKANPIFDAFFAWVEENGPFPRNDFDPGVLWGGPMALMQIHAIRQDREAVLTTLRAGIDAGYLGWFGQDGPLFDFIRDDPEWRRQMDRLAENTERQWELYRKSKNEPLF